MKLAPKLYGDADKRAARRKFRRVLATETRTCPTVSDDLTPADVDAILARIAAAETRAAQAARRAATPPRRLGAFVPLPTGGRAFVCAGAGR